MEGARRKFSGSGLALSPGSAGLGLEEGFTEVGLAAPLLRPGGYQVGRGGIRSQEEPCTEAGNKRGRASDLELL